MQLGRVVVIFLRRKCQEGFFFIPVARCVFSRGGVGSVWFSSGEELASSITVVEEQLMMRINIKDRPAQAMRGVCNPANLCDAHRVHYRQTVRKPQNKSILFCHSRRPPLELVNFPDDHVLLREEVAPLLQHPAAHRNLGVAAHTLSLFG